MSTNTNLRLMALFTTFALLLPTIAAAGKNPVKDFYDQKHHTTDRAAYERAAARLEKIEPGISERRLLRHLEMAVLAREGKPMDVAMDGYLADESKKLNKANRSRRHVVLGWIDEDGPHPQVVIVLEGQQVVEIRRVSETQVAENATAR